MDLHKRISRRSFLKVAGLAATGAAAVACSPAGQPAASSLGRRADAGTERVQLVYQDWRTDWFPEMAQRMLEEFHATHPNIRVYYTPDPDDLEDRMLSDMQAGTAPDVLAGCCEVLPIWAQMGYLLDLRPYVQADLDTSTIGDWDPAQYKAFLTPGDMQFALPKYHGALALYYNKDLFDRARVDYPDGSWTHDDYLDAMRRVVDPHRKLGRTTLWGSMVDITWDRLQVHANGWGGHFVSPDDSTKSWMGKPEALAAMEWIRARIWDDRLMATSLDVNKMETRQAFSAGLLAMVEDGSWALKDILATAKFRVGVAPFPAGPARRVTLATTDGFAIYSGTRHPEAAWELMKFLTGKTYGRAMAQANFLQPARASLVDEWAANIRQEFPDQAKEIDLAAFADGHIKGYSVTAEVFANMSDAQRLARAAWERVFTLGQTGVNALKTASEQIEALQTDQKG